MKTKQNLFLKHFLPKYVGYLELPPSFPDDAWRNPARPGLGTRNFGLSESKAAPHLTRLLSVPVAGHHARFLTPTLDVAASEKH